MAGDINHLGSCARATTINNEDLVLTTSEGVRFKISKGDLAKAMREAFPAATTIGNEDKIPIIQGGVDKTTTFQSLSNAVVDKVYRPSDFGTTTIDANNCKENIQISAQKWLNTPLNYMGVLKVNRYNDGWVVQKFHVLSTAYVTFEYQRMWVENERWTDWKKVEYK